MDNNLEKNIEVIKKEYNNSPDIISRTITINNKKIALMYNQSLCDSKHINNFILKNISYSIELDKKLTITSVFDFFYNSSPANNVIKIDSYKDIYEYLSNSYTIILFDNVKEAI